jgi:hypothetical protein
MATTLGSWRLWNYDPSKADVFSGNPVQHGIWQMIKGGHVLVPMHDGKVLDWVPDNGSWRLWNYDPSKADVLPGNPVQNGTWQTIKGGHELVPMHDGKVLDWVADNGSWRLWNYDPSKAEVLPGNPVQHGTWETIASEKGKYLPFNSHHLVPMHDGKVLDWIPSNGSWRLWNYDPSQADVLPGKPVQHGTWQSIKRGHALVPMHDGKVLDWIPDNGSWRLWNYDPSKADILSGNPVRSGTSQVIARQWEGITQFWHELVPMHDGRVLDWVSSALKVPR